MPTLLLKCLVVFHTFREEYSIEVYINQIVEILFLKQQQCIKIHIESNKKVPHFKEQTHETLEAGTFVFVEATG